VDFPLEYHAELLGDAASEGTSPLATWVVIAAAALAVFLLLQAAFGSWRLALLAFGLLAAALGGGVITILVTGANVTLGSLAGLVGVLTIASRAIVLLIRSYQRRQLRDGMVFGPDLVIDSTAEWVGPTLASTAATGALVAPMLVMGGTGMELLQPMAVVVVGGVITSALIALGVLPSLYLRYGYVPEPDMTAELLDAQPVQAGAPAGKTGR
jgi:Cu/Ag efflux pump CusA